MNDEKEKKNESKGTGIIKTFSNTNAII